MNMISLHMISSHFIERRDLTLRRDAESREGSSLRSCKGRRRICKKGKSFFFLLMGRHEFYVDFHFKLHCCVCWCMKKMKFKFFKRLRRRPRFLTPSLIHDVNACALFLLPLGCSDAHSWEKDEQHEKICMWHRLRDVLLPHTLCSTPFSSSFQL